MHTDWTIYTSFLGAALVMLLPCDAFSVENTITGLKTEELTPVTDVSQPALAPDYTDNTVEPDYKEGSKTVLSTLEEGILERNGDKQPLSKLLARDQEHQAALRVVYGNARIASFTCVTYLFSEVDLNVRYVAYPDRFQTARDRNAVIDLLLAADPASLTKECDLWSQKFALSVRNRVARELNTAHVFSLKSCRPHWNGGDLEIPIVRKTGEVMRHKTPESGPVESFRVFFVSRKASGEIAEHSFEVSMPQILADTRYERLLYSLGDCVPFRKTLSQMKSAGSRRDN